MERVDKVPREVRCSDSNYHLKNIQSKWSLYSNNLFVVQITCAELQKDVLLLEEQEGSVNFKIGVMLMKPGQKTDDEMLSNGKYKAK